MTLASLLSAARARFADRPAVTSSNGTLTYAELFARADALRTRLLLAGAGPGALVALHLRRGPNTLVGLLAVLLAGAGYVALDPSYPRARLRLMADEADPVLALGDDDTVDLLAGRVPVVGIDDHATADADPEPLTSVPRSAVPGAEDVCYAFFTSGSTGRPKGIPASHANVVAFLAAMDAAVVDGPDRPGRWLGLTSPSFDPSVVELLWTTTRGHQIVLPPPGPTVGLVADGTLAATLEAHAVTHVQCTPTVLQMLLADPDHRRALRHVRQLFLGGEALPRPLARDAARAIAAAGTVTNLYGPTETTVWAFAHHVRDGDDGPVPVGRPLPGVRTRVHADDGTPAPHGTVGELLIGGPGVAAGYLGRPDLTAERFLVLDDGGPVRYYRTGDLVSVRPDGVFDFLGRGDDQVKVQGTRIELGDVETAVATHPSVARAVAFVVGEGLDAQLAVAVVPAGGPGAATFDGNAVRRHVSDRLPPGMVPARVVAVDDVPLTPSGKTDRRALARSVPAASDVDVDDVRALFAATLSTAEVGPDDDFFDRGGDSLAALELMARVHERYGVLLGLSTLVQAATPAALADRLRAHRAAPGAETQWRSVVALADGDGDGMPFFCVHGVGGNVLNLVPLARALPTATPFYGIQAAGVDGKEQPDPSVAAMVGRYVDDIRSVRPHGPYAIGGYSDGGVVAVEVARALEAAGEQVHIAVLFDADVPAPGGRTLAHRLANLRANLQARGGRAMAGAVTRAVLRRVSPSRRAAERDLGYRDTGRSPYVDLAPVLGRALTRHVPAPCSLPVLQVRAERFRPCDEPESRWAAVLHGPVTRVVVPGDHLTMFSAEHAERLAAALAPHLAPPAAAPEPTSAPEPAVRQAVGAATT